MMYVPLWAWLATTLGLVALLALDLVIVDRKPHKVSAWEAGRWVILYVGCAVVFGLLVWLLAGGKFAGEFFSGYLTEYSLSVDNLFVFLVIMTAFKVPAIHQHRVLLIGIVIALVLRSVLIMAGSLLISKFFAIFYVFGAFLIFTAYRLVRGLRQTRGRDLLGERGAALAAQDRPGDRRLPRLALLRPGRRASARSPRCWW